jgi:hypothetical protein
VRRFQRVPGSAQHERRQRAGRATCGARDRWRRRPQRPPTPTAPGCPRPATVSATSGPEPPVRREPSSSPTAGRRASLAEIRSAASTYAGSSSRPQLSGCDHGTCAIAQMPACSRGQRAHGFRGLLVLSVEPAHAPRLCSRVRAAGPTGLLAPGSGTRLAPLVPRESESEALAPTVIRAEATGVPEQDKRRDRAGADAAPARGRLRSSAAARIRHGVGDRLVAIGVVRSESTQIVKAVAREPSGAAGLRLKQSRPSCRRPPPDRDRLLSGLVAALCRQGRRHVPARDDPCSGKPALSREPVPSLTA